jgi:uncharacterized membrane protein YdjX (TVP38/TMEM64 family)
MADSIPPPTSPAMSQTQTKPAWRRWAPVLVLVALMALAFAMGWHKYLSFKTVGLNYEAMRVFISDNLLLALLIYMGVYIAAVALSLPGGLILTVSGGLLFGWQIGAPATIIAATIGATILFLVAKTSLGESLAEKAGPWIGKLRDGFKENALSYLLFLRLVPAFPFFVVNLAPALLGVNLRTYIVGTFFGIIPGTLAYSVAGSGLGSVVEAQNASYQSCLASNPEDQCPYSIDTSALVTKELIAAFALIGIVALIPVFLKKWKSRNGGQ